MIRSPTDFPYLGDRSYIHGTSALIAGLALLEEHASGPVILKRLRFLKGVSNNGQIVLCRGNSLIARFKESSWHMTCQSDADTWQVIFIEEKRNVTRREHITYPLSHVSSDGNFGGSAEIAPQGRDDLIRVIVEANKQIHLMSLPAQNAIPQVRFGYLENWNVPPVDCSFTGRLLARNLAARKSGARLSTINRIEYQPQNGQSESMIVCFELEDATGTQP